jgi:phage terminase large subunit-like protein
MSQRDYTRIAKKYARDIITGKIPACRQIILACERWERDLTSKQWTYDRDKAHAACSIIELLPHVKGQWARERRLMTLEPWQIFIMCNLFGLVDKRGFRKHREAFLLIPRKNGKSTLAAGIALVMAFADDEAGAEVYIGANSEQQAHECFRPAKIMASSAVGFTDHFGVEVRASAILSEGTGSFVKTMIGKPGDGSSPHCAILDEAHENADSDQRDTMLTGMGARQQPLLVTITTAGANSAGPCRQQQAYAETVLNGVVDDPRLFAMVFTIDKGDDWRDFSTWQKANPNFGVSVSEEFLIDRHKEALNRPEKAAVAQTKHLNVWVSSRSAWLNMADWQKAADKTLDIEALRGKRAWLGLDLSTKIDITAVIALVEIDHERWAYFPYMFVPETALERAKNAESYRQWADTGELLVTDGNVTDFSVIEAKVRELCALLDVQSIGFDQWQAQDMAQRIQTDGVTVIACPANVKTFSPAMVDFEAELAASKIVHPDNRAFTWMASNVVAKADVRGNLYPRKPDGQDHLKIDGIVAALMAKAVSRESAPVSSAPLLMVW